MWFTISVIIHTKVMEMIFLMFSFPCLLVCIHCHGGVVNIGLWSSWTHCLYSEFTVTTSNDFKAPTVLDVRRDILQTTEPR